MGEITLLAPSGAPGVAHPEPFLTVAVADSENGVAAKHLLTWAGHVDHSRVLFADEVC
jgi:hypothetical protein